MLRPGVLEEGRAQSHPRSGSTSGGEMVSADGTLQLPAGCELLSKLYANHGVRIRMVRRQKIPTVRQLIDQLSRKHEMMLQQQMDARRYSSSSTPTVPFLSSELLYGGPDVTGRHGHAVGGDDGCGVELGTWGGDKQKLRELDLGNRRPPSRNSTSRKVASFDRVAFDRDREELRPIANSLPPSKQNPLRASGIKNTLLRADQNLNPRGNASATGRDEDLVAMGTLWSPSHLQTRSSTTTSSSKSTSAANSAGGGGGAGGQYPTSTLTARRPINLSTTTSTRQLLYHTPNSTSTLPNPGMGNFVKGSKEVEPKYSDPLAGAPPTFQQRMMELAALEAETVRWERTKKVKKKPKQDRDS